MKQLRHNASGPKAKRRRATQNKSIPLLAIASCGAGLQTATQYLAHLFDYQEGLGASWNHVYLPWSIVTWGQQSYALYPQQFTTAGSLGAMLTALGLIGCAMAKRVGQNSSTINEHLHGSARWANQKDIIASSLLGTDEGVYVGAWEDKKGATPLFTP